MHYVPESACELLRDDPLGAGRAAAQREFHHRTAPLYVLTAAVAALLIADVILGSGWFPTAATWQSLLGYRLALWAALLGGARILYHTLDGIFSGRFGADLALTIACLGAIILGEHQTAGLVVLIALIGESLEGYTLDCARRALRSSFALQPVTAHLCESNGERDVSITELRPNDVVAIRPGESLPIDGVVVTGKSTVDESTLTGEAAPVDKSIGSPVVAGTVNQFGGLQVRVERAGSDTTIAKISALVQQAVAKKSRGERLADQLAQAFLPAVLVAAALTLIGWRLSTGTWSAAWLPALAVLVVACPCPLVLATPCAVLATMAGLARRGIVVKGSTVLERLASVDTIAFDKTGTLTQGAITIAGLHPEAGVSHDALLAVAATAERRSEHLLARVLVNAAESAGLEFPAPYEFTTQPGAGIIATIRSSALAKITSEIVEPPRMVTLVVGTRDLLVQQGVTPSAATQQLASEASQSGQTTLFVAFDGRCLGVIGVRDTVRQESRSVLDALREQDVSRWALLTGDRAAPAAALLKELPPFEYVASEQSPIDKAEWIKTQHAAGHRVAMMGDGINDAPALAVADVGLVVVRPGADLAAEAGDVLLLGDPLRPLPGLIRRSRAMVQNIRQSVFWFAFGVNGFGVMASSFGWLSPVTAALFHEVASIAVMINALRLLWDNDPSTATQADLKAVAAINWDAWLAWWSPSAWVYWILEHRRMGSRLAVAAIAITWLLSQFVRLSVDEQAVVTRLGKHHTVLSAGWHWRWPWPLESVTRVRPDFVHTVTLGVSAKDSATKTDPSVIEWTSEHAAPDANDAPSNSLFLTADEVLVDISAELQYRTISLTDYIYRGGSQINGLCRMELEAVLRELTARHPLDDWLTDDRVALEQRVQRAVTERITALSLGIEIVDVQLLDVHPPQPVVAAYRQVSDALEDQERQKNIASATAARTLISAMGDELSPEAGTAEPIEMTDELWQSWLNEKPSRLSGTAAAQLEAAAATATEHQQRAIASAQRLKELLAAFNAAPQTASTILYWDRVTPMLSRRPLVLIDPKAVGRQQWWMIDGTASPQLTPLNPVTPRFPAPE